MTVIQMSDTSESFRFVAYYGQGPGYAFAVIPHPISSASDGALRDMAAAASAQARRLLLRP
jgi:hypothetical protein